MFIIGNILGNRASAKERKEKREQIKSRATCRHQRGTSFCCTSRGTQDILGEDIVYDDDGNDTSEEEEEAETATSEQDMPFDLDSVESHCSFVAC